MRIRELISQFTTPHACCEPRVTNIQRAASILDGQIIPAGATFSLNTALGERTRARGFVSAPQIGEGGKLEDAVGGGVSQTATTVFNAAFFAGLRIVTHTPHEFWITRYPAGREATVSWGGPELIVENDWPAAILLKAYDTGTSLTVQMYSSKLGRRVTTETTGTPVAGTAFSVDVHARGATSGRQGEARRELLVVLRGPVRLTSRAWRRLGDAFPVVQAFEDEVIRAGFRPAQMVLVAFLVTFGCVRAYTYAARHGRGPGNLSVGGKRVHHMVPGIFLLLVAGFIAVDRRGRLAALVPVVGAAHRLRRRRGAGARRVRDLAQPARRLLDRGGAPLDRRGDHRGRVDRDRGAGGAVLGAGDLGRRPGRGLPDRGLPRAQRRVGADLPGQGQVDHRA